MKKAGSSYSGGSTMAALRMKPISKCHLCKRVIQDREMKYFIPSSAGVFNLLGTEIRQSHT